MHTPNVWGGNLEVYGGEKNENEEHGVTYTDWDRASLAYQPHMQQKSGELDEIQRSWLLAPAESGGGGGFYGNGGRKSSKMKKKYVDFGCFMVSRKLCKMISIGFIITFCVVGLPVMLATTLNRHKGGSLKTDNYSLALHKALKFFNAQKSGKLSKNNGISWRSNSALHDGPNTNPSTLVGGYYDSGSNTKSHFPLSFTMTLLSWSLIEYPHKYHSLNEYDHTRSLIKWGINYLLKTFNSSSTTPITYIYSQVGGGCPPQNTSKTTTPPNDYTCWTRPEDMTYKRLVHTTHAGPDLASEMSAAFAAASIVFLDQPSYSRKLIHAAELTYEFARDRNRRATYSRGNTYTCYNSTSYYDEYIWGATWLYYATGNESYARLATNPGFSRNAVRESGGESDTSVFSWDNKLPAAKLLLTRLRVFLNPGYPYEEMLNMYHNHTGLNMCSYLKRFEVFNFTKSGLILLNHGKKEKGGGLLQYVVNTVFLVNLFADYMNATGVAEWNCGDHYFPISYLRDFATTQMDYILGKNPTHMSYVVGYGNKYPRHVHHRGASIPHNKVKYTCKSGLKWRDTKKPNPNTIIGALVGGPVSSDRFKDNRNLPEYTEPTLAGNAGLVAALVSLTNSGGYGVNKNLIFSGVPPLYPQTPPPPPPWKPY